MRDELQDQSQHRWHRSQLAHVVIVITFNNSFHDRGQHGDSIIIYPYGSPTLYESCAQKAQIWSTFSLPILQICMHSYAYAQKLNNIKRKMEKLKRKKLFKWIKLLRVVFPFSFCFFKDSKYYRKNTGGREVRSRKHWINHQRDKVAILQQFRIKNQNREPQSSTNLGD